LRQYRQAQTLAVAAKGDPVQRLKEEMRASHRAPTFRGKTKTAIPEPTVFPPD